MRVLILSPLADTGGVGYQLKLALERHTDWAAVQVVRSANYIAYPHDRIWPIGDAMPDWLLDEFAKADVLHVMEGWDACRAYDAWREKPLVLHHHGTAFRANHAFLTYSAKELRAERIVSTPDLQLIDTGAEWLPNPVDADGLMAVRAAAEMATIPSEFTPFTIAHTPTNRAYKSTELAQRAADQAGVMLDVVEGVSWAESVTRKAHADAVFDQLRSGYGLSGLEAMAMGVPVIGGANDPDLAALGVPGGSHLLEHLVRLFGYLPFLAADQDTLALRMAELRDDGQLRLQVAEAGEDHVHRYHDPELVARQLVAVYERAIEAKR